MPNFNDYNKLCDIMYHLSNDTSLRLNVSLNYIIKKEKKSYHREVQTNNGIKLTRDFSYNYSIEKNTFDTNDFARVVFRPEDMVLLERTLDKVCMWFEDNQHFMIKDKKLIALKQDKPLVLNGLVFNGYIQFDPIVYQFDEASPVSPGVRLTLGAPDKFVDVDVNKFYGIVYLLKGKDMFARAQNLVSYFGRPEYGTNLYVMDAFANDYSAPKYEGGFNHNSRIPPQSNIVAKKREMRLKEESETRGFFNVRY